MQGIILKVDTAVAVPVNCLPLVDDGDFVTVEDALAYNASGMDLRWNFVTTDGVQSSTAVTPTSGGDYDWTHMGDGIYSIEIPASGGASINNDTEGYGWFSGRISGVLPFRGPIITFAPSHVVDGLVSGSDQLQVDLTHIRGTASAGDAGYVGTDQDKITNKTATVNLSGTTVQANVTQISGDSTAADNCESFFDGTGYAGTNNTIPTVSSVTSVAGLAAGAVQSVWTSALTEAYGTDGSPLTGAQLLYLLLAHVGEFSISGTTKTLKKIDGSTTAATCTLNDAVAPTSITRAT